MSSTEKNNIHISGPSYLFLSDVHLGAFDDSKNNQLEDDLVQLIDFCEKNHVRPVVLGDFFDFWMEYKGFRPALGTRILGRFAEFHKKTGNNTLFITGNHDNWTLNDGVLKQTGFDLEHEYRIMDINNSKVMVFHGDGFKKSEMKYPRPMFHRILRNPIFTSIYRALLSPTRGLAIMAAFSKHSRKKSNAEDTSNSCLRLNRWVDEYSKENSTISAYLYGHTHHAEIRQNFRAVMVNCGYFGKDRTACLYTNHRFELVYWNSADCTLTRFQKPSV
ncbi:metallophosphoesterase family protein [Balneolaceae bacterium ANBcel3]|nr:metallophosphoesterase family protein [Balneolaceae bacterium ANBcel3]